MHNNHLLLGHLQRLLIDNEAILEALEFRQIHKPLLLHARAVQHIGAGDELGSELVALGDEDASFGELVANLLREDEDGGRDELDLDAVVEEELGEGVHGAAVAEVAHEGDGEVVDGAELFADGEEVEEGLSRVLEGAVA